MIEFERIYRSYENCTRRKATKSSAIQFSYIQLIDNLQSIVDDINSRTYEHSRSSCFITTYPCPREIYAAQYRDRIVQHFFIEEIEDILEVELTDRSASCRVGKGTDYALTVLKEDMIDLTDKGSKDGFFFKLDLHGYFMSISRERINTLMIDLIQRHYFGPYKSELLYLSPIIFLNNPATDRIMKCSERDLLRIPPRKRLDPFGKCGMAIGNITAQLGSNLYMNGFDKFCINELGFTKYIRYVDDIIILSNTRKQLVDSRPQIIEFLSDMGLRINDRKTIIDTCYHGVKFLGRITFPYGYQKQSHESAGRVMRSAMELPIDDNLLSRLNSQMGRFRHYSCFNLLQDYLNALPREVWNYVYFDYSKMKFLLW